MKKAISILMSALLITGLFTACNSTPEPSQVENIPNISSTPSAEVPIVTNTPDVYKRQLLLLLHFELGQEL